MPSAGLELGFTGPDPFNNDVRFVGFTRFSVADFSVAFFRATTRILSEEDYLAHLFSEERLATRFDIFENFWIRCLSAAAKGFKVRHLVFYSERLPEKWKKRLRALELPEWLALESVGNFGQLNRRQREIEREAFQLPGPVGVYHLDDDDLLGPLFFPRCRLT